MVVSDVGRRQRAEVRRARATLHKTRLSEERDPTPVFGSEAVSLVLHLTRESYALAGLDEPNYTRDHIPYRFVPWSHR